MHQDSQLCAFIQEGLEDMKAEDITMIHVAKMTTITDFMIICTGNSNQHVRSIAQNLVQKAKKEGVEILSQEGKNSAEWVLVDFGDAIVHVMTREAREYYDIEKLWSFDECDSE